MQTFLKTLPLILVAALFAPGCLGQAEPTESDPAEAVGETKEELAPGTIYDGPGESTYNVCNGMHCCAAGWAMVGIHVGDNIFSCREAIAIPAHELCYVDQGTVRDGMHACGEGYYMKGVNVGQNLLTCCRDWAGDSPGEENVNLTGNDGFMHTCNYGQQEAMTGIHVANNWLLCQQWSGVAQ
jgi:hypothetical protein